MSDNKDNWNIYYCGDDSELTQNESVDETLQESSAPVEDIPVSKYRRYDMIVDDSVEEEYTANSFHASGLQTKKEISSFSLNAVATFKASCPVIASITNKISVGFKAVFKR